MANLGKGDSKISPPKAQLRLLGGRKLKSPIGLETRPTTALVRETNSIRLKKQLRLLGGQKVESPIGSLARPTTSLVREAIMNILNQRIINSPWLDLYSGSGIMGCEAIQRGAKNVVAVEINKKTSQICKSNFNSVVNKSISESYFEVITAEVLSWLKEGFKNQSKKFINRFDNEDNRFDLVYLDPPYEKNIYSYKHNRFIWYMVNDIRG